MWCSTKSVGRGGAGEAPGGQGSRNTNCDLNATGCDLRQTMVTRRGVVAICDRLALHHFITN